MNRSFTISLSLLAVPTAGSLAGAGTLGEASFELTLKSWTRFVTHKDEGHSCLSILSRDPDLFTGVEKGDIGMQYNSLSSDVHIRGMLGLWLQNPGWDFEWDWWMLSTARGSRFSRLTALALMVCMERDEGAECISRLRSYAQRFAEPERAERLAELDLVRRNRSGFGKVFSSYLSKNPSKAEYIVHLRTIFAKFDKAQ